MTSLKNKLLGYAAALAFLLFGSAIETWQDENKEGRLGRASLAAIVSGVIALVILLSVHFANARDHGQFGVVDSATHEWFEHLRSGKGPCCSDADGVSVEDPDWETKDNHYRVRLDGEWIDVPEEAVITEPNRIGKTMVWPIKGYMGTSIRCFMPGSMT